MDEREKGLLRSIRDRAISVTQEAGRVRRLQPERRSQYISNALYRYGESIIDALDELESLFPEKGPNDARPSQTPRPDH